MASREAERVIARGQASHCMNGRHAARAWPTAGQDVAERCGQLTSTASAASLCGRLTYLIRSRVASSAPTTTLGTLLVYPSTRAPCTSHSMQHASWDDAQSRSTGLRPTLPRIHMPRDCYDCPHLLADLMRSVCSQLRCTCVALTPRKYDMKPSSTYASHQLQLKLRLYNAPALCQPAPAPQAPSGSRCPWLQCLGVRHMSS